MIDVLFSFFVFPAIFLLLSLLFGGKRQFIKTLLYGLIGGLTSYALKLIFSIPRIGNCTVECFDPFSFPSGHAMVAFLMALAMFDTPVFGFSIIYAILVLWFRIVSEVHGLFDVFASVAFSYIIFLSIEWLSRVKRFSSFGSNEVFRQFIHILVGICVLFSIVYFNAVITSIWIFGLIVFITLYSKYIAGRFSVLDLIESLIERSCPLFGFGALSLLSSLLLVISSIKEMPLLVLVVFALGVSDGVATLIGSRFGSVRLPWNGKKSLQGFIAFFTLTFLFSLYLGFSINFSLMFSIAASLIESLPFDDNISLGLFGVFVSLIK